MVLRLEKRNGVNQRTLKVLDRKYGPQERALAFRELNCRVVGSETILGWNNVPATRVAMAIRSR